MTDAGTKLRRTIAEFYQVEEGRVGPAFSLAARQGSIARAALDAAIRSRVGLRSRAVYSAKTFGELAAGLGVGINGDAGPSADASAPPSPATLAPASAPAGSASCGVDIELVADLPVAADPWEDAFYRAQFSPSEIAYCLRQAEPRLHFAGRWCVKEALKKCDRAYLVAEGREIEVAHDEAGAPRLVHLGPGGPSPLPHAVSLSHTSHAAVAVVVRVDAAPAIPAPATALTPPAPAVIEARPAGRGAGMVSALVQVATLIVAALALYRTYTGH